MIRLVPRRASAHATPPRAIAPRATRAEAASLAERLLQSLGAEHDFAEAVLGDLAEEYAIRTARDGAAAARRWYAREALRSAPHLVWSWFQHASRYDRARLTAMLAGIAFTLAILVVAVVTRDGPPARFVAGTDDSIIINNELPVHLRVQVVDARGHSLNPSGVRFRWMSGAPIRVSQNGLVTCAESGDAQVRISLGAISHELLLRCRPVSDIKQVWDAWNFVVGDSAHTLPISATGPDGKPVDLVAGSASVRDSDVASLNGLSVRPKAAGRTELDVTVGDDSVEVPIIVYERASSPAALRVGQAFVSTMRLAGGDVRRWPLQPGLYKLSLETKSTSSSAAGAGDQDSTARLVLAMQNANCVDAGPDQDYMCVALAHAAVVIYAPRNARPEREFTGHLSVLRDYSVPAASDSW